jgi:hypothetical protein
MAASLQPPGDVDALHVARSGMVMSRSSMQASGDCPCWRICDSTCAASIKDFNPGYRYCMRILIQFNRCTEDDLSSQLSAWRKYTV